MRDKIAEVIRQYYGFIKAVEDILDPLGTIIGILDKNNYTQRPLGDQAELIYAQYGQQLFECFHYNHLRAERCFLTADSFMQVAKDFDKAGATKSVGESATPYDAQYRVGFALSLSQQQIVQQPGNSFSSAAVYVG